MDPLDFLKQEELLRFFRYKKTEMSYMDQPHTFLRQLRDYNLVPEKLYQRVIRMKTKEQKKNGVYEVLDSLETNQPQCVKTFWQCVFTDHIMQLYPTLRLLRNSLMDGSFSFTQSQAEMESTSKGKEGKEGKNEDLKETKVKKRSRQKRKGSSTSEREEGVEEEEEEEEDQSVETSMKKKKKKKKKKKPIYSSPLTKGGREDIWNWPMCKAQLPVTCGDKEGFLHRDKLARGEPCIVHQDRWYTPGEFEKLGGKERCKNWKTSIRCRNTTLQKLIQENHLKYSPVKRRKRDSGQKQVKRALFTSSTQTSISMSKSIKEERSSSDEAEDSSEGEKREGRKDEGVEGRMAEAGLGAHSDHDDQDIDASAFEGSALPVLCGSVTGILQKDRFASGNKGKCIRTEDSWLTPAEFIRLNPDLTDGKWKRDITCRGQRLSYLLQKKILQVHSLLCMCRMCSLTESDLEDERNDDHCFVCREQGELLLCCDGCPRSFHEDCHLPTPTQGDDWLCTFCVWRKTQDWLYTDYMTQRQVLDNKISEYKLQCQYLLLFLLNADEQKLFTTDPCPIVSGYSSVIPRPMWLQKVRENLESRYTLVGEFISDIRLIFRNCAIFNRNNPEFRDMGIQLGTLFEEEFQKTFNISAGDIHQRDRSEGRGKGLIEVKGKREEQDSKDSGVPDNPSSLSTPPLGRSTCQRNERRCESCAKVPDSSHWVLVMPEVSTEKSISTYSLSSPAGSYECSESGLRWSCAAPVTLQYCFTDWHLLADELPHMQYRPAGPSMDIKLISGELQEIHLPHFLCLGDSQSYLMDSVNILHKQDSGVFMEKCELSRFHARLVKPSCSPLGIFFSLKSLIFPGKQEEKEPPVKIHADVQVYRSSTSPLTFRTYLLPEDASLIKLLEKQEESFRGLRLPKPRPEEPLQMDGFYAVHTTPESARIYPARLKLRYSSIAPNFSEVRTREAGDFKIELFHPADQQMVWEAEILRSECLLTVLQSIDGTTAAEFLRRHRADLVQKVRNVMPIADRMFSQGHISEENHANISVERTDQDKMRCVFKVLESCGDEGKSALIRILQEHHPDLLEELATVASGCQQHN